MGSHEGHRQRLRERFLQLGEAGFRDHELLELLLFYALPRGNTNELAHALLGEFGSLAGVLDAPPASLQRVSGVGEHTALLLSMLPQVFRRYQAAKLEGGVILSDSEHVGNYLLPLFIGRRDEVVYVLCLDAKGQVLHERLLFSGDVSCASVSVRKVVEYALSCNASRVILAHNHVCGIAIPSREDEEVTRRVQAGLAAVEIQLMDHIIVAEDDFVSLADSGFFKKK